MSLGIYISQQMLWYILEIQTEILFSKILNFNRTDKYNMFVKM